jgi:hypothetical protein
VHTIRSLSPCKPNLVHPVRGDSRSSSRSNSSRCLARSFTAFDEGPDGLSKRFAKPHQYFAVTKAVGSTVQAVQSNGKAGVVWHTQGSGKSMEMELYANLVTRHPKLKNPTVVVITDRNELDGQLFQTFDRSLLMTWPVAASMSSTRGSRLTRLRLSNTCAVILKTP